MTRRLLTTRRRRLSALAAMLATLAVVTGAVAYFTSTGAGTAAASVGAINPPTAVTAQESGADVTISWNAATLTSGADVQGYRVERSDGATVCGTPSLVTTPSCTDTAVPGGTYTYTVTAVFNSFTAPASSGPLTILSAPTLTPTPSDPSANSAPGFGFGGGGGSGYQCRLDGATFTACSSPDALGGLSDGAHTLQVQATQGGSNGPTATYTWTVDTTAATITEEPSNPSNEASPTFSFTHAEPVYTFTCQLDGGGYSACTSPQSLSGLGDGSHTFQVEAVSADGATTSATSYTWTLGTTPPVTTITLSPRSPNGSAGWYGTAPRFTLSARDTDGTGVAWTRYQIDGGTPQTYTGAVTIPEGQHTVTYWSRDNAGVTETPHTTGPIEVDTTAPTSMLTLAHQPAGAFLSGSTLYYSANAGGSFNLSDAVSDSGSGPGSVSFPDVATSGWSHPAETVSNGSGSAPTVSYTSASLSWSANAGNPAGYAITSADAAGNTTRTPVTFVNDSAAPTGAALSVNGTLANRAGSSGTTTSGSFPIDSRTDYSETQNATQSGLQSSTLTVQSEAMTGTTCGTPGSGGPFTTPTPITGTTQPSGILGGFCYLYTLTGTDKVGNIAAISTTVAWNVLSSPIDPRQLTWLPFGDRSYWLQPWRSSLVTQPATALQNAIGINFNVLPGEASATARLLHDSGFRRARLEIGWDEMSYVDPTQIADPSRLTQYLTALRDNGIRPLILLNANDQAPGPMVALNLTLTASAAAGATTVSLSSKSAAKVVPGLTGINENGVAAQVLVTSVSSGGTATLSQPLPASLAAGSVAASTLRYEPFAPPYLADGSANPRYQQTLAGWLTYVKAVTQFVRNVYGSDSFDVEVWNELSFGSDFLNEKKYFSPVPDPGSTGDVGHALLAATIQTLRDPANGVTNVKVGDGFSDQEPYTSGATVPPGTDAIDKHPYAGSLSVYPGSPPVENQPAVGAQGQRGTTKAPVFTPTFRSFFPEYYLNGIQTETLMRDLSPMQTSVNGVAHGAGTHPAGSSPPAMWITEDNLDATVATANGLPAADLPEFQAKAALRFLVSYASAGVQAIDLFGAGSAGGPGYQLVPQAFFNAVDANPASYPANLGGQTMQAVGRLAATLSGAQPIVNPRQLTLDAIAQYGNDSQFTGNGTTAFPTLYNRDVLAFFPFQVAPNTFVAPVYVMTRDLTHYYTSSPAAGQTPYDLPPEQYQLTIGNVNAAAATVSLYDPLTDTQEPASIVSRGGSQIVVALAATDSPRMLTITDG